MKRYKQNLKIDGNRVISYTTHVATIDYSSGIITELGYWSQTTRKHINYVAQELGMSVHYYDATHRVNTYNNASNQHIQQRMNMDTSKTVLTKNRTIKYTVYVFNIPPDEIGEYISNNNDGNFENRKIVFKADKFADSMGYIERDLLDMHNQCVSSKNSVVFCVDDMFYHWL